MPTMNIKDPKVREMALELAALQGSSATAAVRGALEEALAKAKSSRLHRQEVLRRLQESVADTADWWASDQDLYDDQGLPR